jgi:hypothetical protein
MSINADTHGGYTYTVPTTGVVLNLPSAARATYSSGLLNVDSYNMLAIDFSITAITGGLVPTVSFRISRQGVDGVLYPIFTTTAVSVIGLIPPISFGPGSSNAQMFGDQVQVDMITTGSPTSVTFSASIKGK